MPAIHSQQGLAEPRSGMRVWFKFREGRFDLWDVGKVSAVSGDSITVQGSCGTSTLPPSDVFVASSPGDLQEDMIALAILQEVSVLDNLYFRYKHGHIYTNVGPILIAVNPYRQLNIYQAQTMVQCRKAEAQMGIPHIYSIANNCYKNMMRTSVPQSVLVSGESGAGKTESTKYILHFLSEESQSRNGGQSSGVQERVLMTNPMLEAFGNAKTVRNNNSSRFGKYITLEFTKDGQMVGGFISVYLLEKSRVCSHTSGERSYHIFYQLMTGATPAEKDAAGLTQFNRPRYMIPMGQSSWISEDFDSNFSKIRESLQSIGLENKEQEEIWNVLGAVLVLGTVELEGTHDNANVSGHSSTAIAQISQLLGVGADGVEGVLTNRSMLAGTERLKKHLGKEAAEQARDAMAKALYSALFEWIVRTTNRALVYTSPTGSAGAMAATGRSISVLDIFGFENFVQNGFEQLNINYANERLQGLFCKHVFKAEQQEYIKENVPWQNVEAPDNSVPVNLLQAKGGILALLSEESRYPKGTDLTFLNKLKSNTRSPAFLSVPATRVADPIFVIDHFAGAVEYTVTGFLVKNRDELGNDAMLLMQNSSKPMLQQMFTPQPDADGGDRFANRRGSGGADTTVCAQFKKQLGKLCATLELSSLHFVRCIKPNAQKAPAVFEAPLVLPQLRCSGVIETVKIRRSGFAVRMTYVSFAAAFAVLLPKSQGGTMPEGDGSHYDQAQAEELLRIGLEMKKPAGDPRQLTQSVLGYQANALSALPAPFRQYVFGNTKLFIKSDKMLQKLEMEREKHLGVIRERLRKLHEEQERKRKEAEARAQAERARKVAEEQERAAHDRCQKTHPQTSFAASLRIGLVHQALQSSA